MKLPYTLSILALFAINLFSSCKEPVTPPTPEEITSALLTASGTTWKMQDVKVDGVDKSSLFTGLTLKFTAGSYSTTNGGPVWPASGTWTFTSDQATTIRRNDNIEVQVQVTATSLKLTLAWDKDTIGPGRTESVSGQHVFTFAP
jgi:hypothetical protein